MLNGNHLGSVTLADFIDECERNQWLMRHSEVRRIAQYCDILKRSEREVRVAHIVNDKAFTARLLSEEGVLVKAISQNLFENEVMEAYRNCKGLALAGECKFDESRTYRGCPVIFPVDNIAIMSYFTYTKPFNLKGDYTWMIVHLRKMIDQVTPTGHFPIDSWKTFRVGDLFDLEEKIPQPKSEIAVFVRSDLYQRFKKEFDAVRASRTDAVPYNWEKDMPPSEI